MALLLGLSALGAVGCTPGGVGDPCTPEDEYQQTFSGFQQTEVNVESRSFQCATRICLVNHFQGRVSCKLGQDAPLDATTGMPTGNYAPACAIPGTKTSTTLTDENNVNVKVPPQLVARQTDKAVYCSCRCNGPDKNARYCECPDGFECAKLVDDLRIPGSTGGNLAGSYCIRSGSAYTTKTDTPQTECSRDNPDTCGCGGDHPDAYCGAPATGPKM
ncbi:MAG TPA: hypothetical protein VHB79_09155 [Polyangiaceae bacterium]|nr:hypothetical protein [Polyangiaceae bacterium]